MTSRTGALSTIVPTALALGVAFASPCRGDWPTYMGDAKRSGVTADAVTPPLREQWAIRSTSAPKPAWPPPQPGWTELPKVEFDDAFYAVADPDSVYFGSSVDNAVHAVDAATGTKRWSFVTSGPVRNAPTLARGHVYFGSDDGKVHCVRAADGTLVWTSDMALDSRQVIGNGRVISLWPVRTSVLVEGDRAYVGAGVFPHHGVRVAALDAATGKPVWRNDALNTFGGFSPQGYLLKSGKHLIVPSGRASPVWLNAEDGSLLSMGRPEGGTRGDATGSYGVIFDHRFYTGTQGALTSFDLDTGASLGKWAAAERLIATPDAYYVLKGPPAPAYGRRSISGEANDVTCYDRTTYDQLPKKDVDGLKKARRWRTLRPDAGAMVLAGRHLVVGAKDEVALLDRDTGKPLWSHQVDGDARGLAVAHGRLFVSTTHGTIHAFAPGEPPVAPKANVTAPEADAARFDDLAKSIASEFKRSKGFGLIVGPGADRLACRLAQGTELQFTSVVTADDELSPARQRVARAGLYGRIVVERGSAEKWPYPDLAADLIVCLGGPPINEAMGREIARTLKPCGGVALFAPGTQSPDKDADYPRALWSAAGIRAANVNLRDGRWLRLTRDALPGSNWWTHQYADAGNSGSSGDKRLKGKLEVLWFGEPGGDEFPDRHLRAASPLLMNGRVYCQGWNFLTKTTTIFCFDAYNGTRHWTREVGDAVRLGLPFVSGNFACDGDSVFVAGGSQCHRLDAETGETKAVYETPPGADGVHHAWGHLAIAKGVVVGSAIRASKTGFSDRVFAFDLASGKLLWQADAKEIRDTTFAIGGGRLLYVEDLDPAPIRPKSLEKIKQAIDSAETVQPSPYLRTVVARDLSTGKPAWRNEVDLTDCGRWTNATWGTLQSTCNDEVLVLGGAYTIYNGGKPLDTVPHRAMAISIRDGKPLWSSDVKNRSRPVIMGTALLAEPNFFDLTTGEKILKKQGNRTTQWSMGPRTGGCGPLSASEFMVFGRGGYTIWRDVTGGPSGNLVGMRPGCHINIIPAGGVVVHAEASSGCTCSQAIQCTVVLRPSP